MDSSQTNGFERRDYKRIDSAAILDITPVDSSDWSTETAAALGAESLNMSLSGMLFSTDEQLEVGSIVKIRILLGESHELNPGWNEREEETRQPIVDVVGKVIRAKGAEEIGYDVAIQFLAIDKEQKEALQRFLE